MNQLALFQTEAPAPKKERGSVSRSTPRLSKAPVVTPENQSPDQLDANQRESWRICWNWSGPRIGGICSFNHCIQNDIDGRPCYVSMSAAHVIAIENEFYILEKIEPVPATVSAGGPPFHGRRFKVRASDIWPYIGHGQVIDDPSQLKLPSPASPQP